MRPVGLRLWGTLQGEQVWAYAGGQLRPGFPRRIGDEFPGVPGGLDAAVECHPEECGGETILFFKGERGPAGRWWRGSRWGVGGLGEAQGSGAGSCAEPDEPCRSRVQGTRCSPSTWHRG